MFRVVPICENELLAAEITDILQDADTSTTSITVDKGTWAGLEGMHIALWQREKETYLSGIQSTANYKLESISSNYRNRKRTLEQKIRDAFDEKIRRMYQSELSTATENYQTKVNEIIFEMPIGVAMEFTGRNTAHSDVGGFAIARFFTPSNT